MKINWTVRIKNPLFWVEVAAAILLPILAYFGLSWEDMTSWATLGKVLLEAIQNPVVIVASAVSVWNAITDPTTKGVSDSEQAMTYTKPKEKE